MLSANDRRLGMARQAQIALDPDLSRRARTGDTQARGPHQGSKEMARRRKQSHI